MSSCCSLSLSLSCGYCVYNTLRRGRRQSVTVLASESAGLDAACTDVLFRYDADVKQPTTCCLSAYLSLLVAGCLGKGLEVIQAFPYLLPTRAYPLSVSIACCYSYVVPVYTFRFCRSACAPLSLSLSFFLYVYVSRTTWTLRIVPLHWFRRRSQALQKADLAGKRVINFLSPENRLLAWI